MIFGTDFTVVGTVHVILWAIFNRENFFILFPCGENIFRPGKRRHNPE
jgi:hypothetical protein